MTKLMTLLTASLCAMVFVIAANPAQALNNFSYVSNTGNDANGCSNPTTDGNAIGLDAAGGAALVSYGNNSVAGNTTNGAFTATVGLQ